MEPDIAFGIVLRRLRKKQNLSQETLAFESGLQRNFISMLELGERAPSMKTLFRLAPPLNTTAAMLVSLTQRELEKNENKS